MCGRIFQTLPLWRLLQIAKTKKVSNEEMHTSSYNICPTTHIPVIKPNKLYRQQKIQKQVQQGDQLHNQQRNQKNQVCFMKWGHYGKQHNLIINGRIQQLTLKRTFLNFIQNRCVVIMEGYYEWNSKKQPYSFKSKDSDHFLVAGLFTDENQIIILTKDSTPQISSVHHRMPVMLSHEEVPLWLDPKNTKDINQIIQKSLLNKQKVLWKNIGFAKLAPHVNTIKQKSAKCLMTIEEYKKELDKTGLMKFWNKKPTVEVVVKQGQILKQKNVSKAQNQEIVLGKRNNLEHYKFQQKICLQQTQKQLKNQQSQLKIQKKQL